MKKKSKAKLNDFLEKKAREAGLGTLRTESGDLFVQGPIEQIEKFREQFEEADRAAIKDFNQSGIQPVEYKVVVFPKKLEEKTAGGIYLPEKPREKLDLAQVEAILIAVGGNCFEDWKPPIPQVGQKVYVAKYAGFRIEGADGKEYQVVSDKDIAGIITEEP